MNFFSRNVVTSLKCLKLQTFLILNNLKISSKENNIEFLLFLVFCLISDTLKLLLESLIPFKILEKRFRSELDSNIQDLENARASKKIFLPIAMKKVFAWTGSFYTKFRVKPTFFDRPNFRIMEHSVAFLFQKRHIHRKTLRGSVSFISENFLSLHVVFSSQ